jgi:tetratricopeptide (TPR) repeat protein
MSEGLSQIGRFTSGAAIEALQQLLDVGGGALVITSGLRDLRFSVTRDEVTLEGLGYTVGDPPDLVREFLCALFWEDPSFIVTPPGAVDRHPQAAVVHVSDVEVGALIKELREGCSELGQLQERVPGVEAFVTVKGEPPPPDVTEPSAQLFRALDGQGSQRGGILSVAADEAGIDPIDAAWITADLLDSGQASGSGFSRGLRYAHLGRATARVDGRRSAHFQRLAGQAYLAEGKAQHAIAAYRSCLAVQPEDVASSEGLITAFDKGRQGAEAKRLRKEVTRLYLQWGMPGRAREHMEVLGETSFEQRNLLLECMLRMRDFQSAIELAERLASTMPEQGKEALAARFMEAGASGAPLDRAVALSGFKSGKGLKLVLWLALLVSLLGAGAVGGEYFLRLEYKKAAVVSRERLDQGDFAGARGSFDQLQEWLGQLGGNAPPMSCLSQVAVALTEIDALEADAKLLEASTATLRWKAAGDSQAALEAIKELRSQAKGPALGELLDGRVAEIETYRSKVKAEVESLEQKLISGKLEEALGKAQEIRTTYADAADLWVKSEIGVRLEVRTTAGTDPRLTVGGQDKALSADPNRPGSYQGEVRLRLDPAAVTVITIASPPSHVERKLELRFDDTLTTANLDLLLVEVKTRRDATPPAGAGSPGVFVVEDEQALVYAGRVAKADLVPEDSSPLFEGFSDLVGPNERFVIYLRSEVKFSRFVFTGLELFLEDVASGAQATPRAVAISPLGEVTRPFDKQDGGTVSVPSLSVVEDPAAVVDAVRATLAIMQRELR